MRCYLRRWLRNGAVTILILFGTLTLKQWREKLEVARDKHSGNSTQHLSSQFNPTQLHSTEFHSKLRLTEELRSTKLHLPSSKRQPINRLSSIQRHPLPQFHLTQPLNSTQLHSTTVTVINHESSQPNSSHIHSNPMKNNSSPLEKSRILILVYTTFWGRRKWVGENREECILDQTSRKQCPLDKFELTYDRKRFTESDLVIFHATDMPSLEHLKSLSKRRPILQRWVYATMESPNSTPDPMPLNGLFNATWTYRSDSEFSAQYAAYVPLSPEEKRNKKAADFTEGKSELVAWLVSNCGPQLRMSYVRELKKYIKVDVFGSCSRVFGPLRSCSKSDERRCLRKYKFYLSFENTLCKDYITEKYWDHLGEDNIVPVVMGGADPDDYTKLAIPGSYINVMDFKTVKKLAQYLHYLDRNKTAYNEYFNWRLKYKKSPYHYPLCNFCKSYALKSELRKPKVYDDLRAYWVGEGMCNKKYQLIRSMWNS